MIKLPYIDMDGLIKRLFMVLALTVPFEMILEVLLGIDTKLKPYRVVGLLILLLFSLRTLKKWTGNQQFQSDLFFYLLFIYGLLLTGFKMMSTAFNTGYFYNDVFQIGIYLGLFIVARHIPFTTKEIRKVFIMLVIGSTINALWVFNSFFVKRNFMRITGFMDNPNYFALSIVISLLFIIAWRSHFKQLWLKIFAIVTFLMLLAVLTISGSRTGLVVFAVGILGQLYFASWKEKKALIIIGAVFAIPLIVVGKKFITETGPLILLNRLQKGLVDDNRLPIWKGVLRASEDTAYLGLGIGQFKSNFHKYYFDEYNDEIRRSIERSYFRSPHSDYLAILVIYGIVGLLCYLTFVGLSFFRLFHRIRSAHVEYQRIHYQYTIMVFLMLLLFGFTQENFFSPLFWLLLTFSSMVIENEDLEIEKENL